MVRLLKRLLKLAIDEFAMGWNKGSMRKRKISLDKDEENEATHIRSTTGLHRSVDEELDRHRRRDIMRGNLKRLIEDTVTLEEEMFGLLCEVDLLYSHYLQNLAELIVLKRKVALLAASSSEDSISLSSLSSYPRSLDEAPVRYVLNRRSYFCSMIYM